MKPTLLIDGDLILYRSCIAVEKEKVWDEHMHVLHSDPHEAWTAITYEFKKLFDRFETKEHVIALGKEPYFRHALFPAYKPKRGRKPLCYSTCLAWTKERYNVVAFPGIEADDVLGIFATREPNTIICSRDKDMRSLPCTLWDDKTVQTIDLVAADYWHMVQTLTGDATDGYAGCPGIGPVRAKALIDDAIDRDAHVSGTLPHCVWPAVVAAYEKAGLTEADAIVQARLARILRDSDWDKEKKEPILWTPPT